MKTTVVLVALVVAAATLAAGAGANGSPYSPGLSYGWPGIALPGRGTNVVAFGMPKSTIVALVRARDGEVLRSTVVRGFYGVPLVTYDGTTGGLSGDGKWVTLSSYGPHPGLEGRTRFTVLSTATLEQRRSLVLRGSWSYDASSPNGSLLYLVQHFKASPSPRYRIRLYDVAAGRLHPTPVVDRLGSEATMRGQPVTRTTSGTGRWAYTLYARKQHPPFVHALDTASRQAYCVDLTSLKLSGQRQWELRLSLESESRLAVKRGARTVALVDTKALKVVG
jgi:hypothetical protein